MSHEAYGWDEENNPERYQAPEAVPSGPSDSALGSTDRHLPFEKKPVLDNRDDLSICPNPDCNKVNLVYPEKWEEKQGKNGTFVGWEVLCRCPNCEWTGIGVHKQDKVDKFDDELDRGTESLMSDHRRLMIANALDETEWFFSALDRDDIFPEDIGRIIAEHEDVPKLKSSDFDYDFVLDNEAKPPVYELNPDKMHVCQQPDCGSELVYPVEWEEYDEESWIVVCRCPECETLTEGIFSQQSVDRLDDELDRGTKELTRSLRKQEKDNAQDYADRFISALQADVILPEDFGRPKQFGNAALKEFERNFRL